MASWSFCEELCKLYERYPRFTELEEKHEKAWGFYKEWAHTDHGDFVMMASKLLEKDRWYNQAQQQLFIAKVKEEIRAQLPKKFDEGLVALTIRPEDGSLETCKEIIDRITKISAVLRMVYVYEQKGEDPEGSPHGWHIHASVKTTYTPSHIKTYVGQATYKKKKGTIVCSVHTTKADWRWEENYMKGNKHMKSKEAACKCDVVFREKLGLEPYYVYEKSS